MSIRKISIIVPVFNEEKTVLDLVGKLSEISFPDTEKEIIIVDDGSTDSTADLLKPLCAFGHALPDTGEKGSGLPGDGNIKVFFHERNQGKGAAMRTGIKAAAGDYIISQDADLEYDPKDIIKLLDKAKESNAAAVYGSRRLDNGKNPKAGFSYYIGGVILTWLTNLLYGTKITDEPTCYKLIRRDLFDKFDLKADGFDYCPEVTAKIALLGHKIHEVSISYSPRNRQEGKKIRLKDAIIAAWTLVKYRAIARKKLFKSCNL